MQADLDAFHSIGDELLTKVLWRNCEDTSEALWLIFSKSSLLFQAHEDYDTISVAAGDVLDAEMFVDLTSSDFWQQFIGQRFGWGWTITNQQGYQDGFLLSFNGIIPQIMLEVMASSIKTHRIGSAEIISCVP
jgi:hypothetical protein